MPDKHDYRGIIVLVIILLILSACTQPAAPMPSATPLPTFDAASTDIPYNLISAERMLAHLGVLTNIQAYSGFRMAGTTGEAEAFDYIEAQLNGMATLNANGLELERQSFEVFVTNEIHNAQLFLTGPDGREIEVPASGLRGSRYVPERALYFDSDGTPGDLQSSPLTAFGEIYLVHTLLQLRKLDDAELAGRILVADFTLFDPMAANGSDLNRLNILEGIDKGAAGLILVSAYTNKITQTHASFVNEGSFLQNQLPETDVPILSVLMEDLAPAGITGWDDLEKISNARMLVDSDVLSPAPSGNLIARIPGKDSSKAMLLTAHIDSPNTPGGFDDGSGTVILLEVAEVLNESGLQPDVDLYLVWNGSHENGIYGSAYFAATHADLLDSALAELTIDCLGLPLEGRSSDITMDFNSFARFGDDAPRWGDYLVNQAANLGIAVVNFDEHSLIADNSNFDTWNVPESDLLYYTAADMYEFGSGFTHYANHWHDAYENVDVVRQVSPILADMARVALTAAIQTGRDQPKLRVSAAPEAQALFVGSHSEVASSMTSLRELGMALAMQGFDVDPLPYSEPVTAEALAGNGIVVLLPTYDYPGEPDPGWSEAELDALRGYVEAGGLLVVTNTAYPHVMTLLTRDFNEDALDINALLEPYGVSFNGDGLKAKQAKAELEHPLTSEAETLLTYEDAGVAFSLKDGQVLYTSFGQPIVALIEIGENGGQVLVVGDLGMMVDESAGMDNLQFLINLAKYARER